MVLRQEVGDLLDEERFQHAEAQRAGGGARRLPQRQRPCLQTEKFVGRSDKLLSLGGEGNAEPDTIVLRPVCLLTGLRRLTCAVEKIGFP